MFGGQTPWGTGLSGEEIYQTYYGDNSLTPTAGSLGWEADTANLEIPEAFGWMVEINPYTGVAKKRTALGRFHHENVAIVLGKSGKVVAYMGDDTANQCVYNG